MNRNEGTPMRIAQIATVECPVRQTHAGSIEGLVWLLTHELTRLGHEVTVFASTDSETDGELVATLPGPFGTTGVPDDWQICEWINLCRAVEQSGRFDVVHSHAYLWGLPLQPLAQAPMVHTLHVWPHKVDAQLWSLVPDACVTAVSHCQWQRYPHLHPAAVIPHGVDPSQFTFRPHPQDYLCYLGRFTWGKGPTAAIDAAQALGMRLLLAGPADEYYREHVEPRVDGKWAEYVGWVGGADRDQFLGNARALLYPIQEPEPFGLVLAEAMLCGTPVAAMRLGAVPEVVDEGVTGYSAASAEDYLEVVRQALTLDRRRVRDRAVERFSPLRMARQYLEVYRQVAAGIPGHPHRPDARRLLIGSSPETDKL
jgi:glycosyltransferase involved in cell wall biosynthesis